MGAVLKGPDGSEKLSPEATGRSFRAAAEADGAASGATDRLARLCAPAGRWAGCGRCCAGPLKAPGEPLLLAAVLVVRWAMVVAGRDFFDRWVGPVVIW